jgi:pyridoxine/pyridoxamine 5'-phosphate oxidase
MREDRPVPHEPVPSRPYMPDYGIEAADAGQGLLPWTWAGERLRTNRNYWLATATTGGRPHLMPVWGVWLDETFYFSSGSRSRKARNLQANARCVVSCENAAQPVVIEGIAHRVTNLDLLSRAAEAYSEKYDCPSKPSRTAS